MTRCVHDFSQKLMRDILVEEHHPSHFLNNTILSFNNPILLRCLWSRNFILHSIFILEGFKFCILKFLPMITSYFDNGNLFLLLFWSLLQSFSVFFHASNFSLINSTQEYLEKSSTTTMMYLLPPKLSVLVGPIKSTWSNSKGRDVAITFTLGWLDLVSFPIWRGPQTIFSTFQNFGKPTTASSFETFATCL